MQEQNISTETILAGLKIEALNDMQLAAIETVKENNHVQLISPTGSGKTLAFLLPLAQLLKPDVKNVQALILVPSRELALQIDEVFRKMSTGYKVTCCYGGHKREIEEKNLVQAPAVIIGTAGRIADHLRRNNFSTNLITTLILDEFDKSLELGFLEEMTFIVKSLTSKTKKILTSATEAASIPDFIEFGNPVQLNFTNTTLIEKDVYDSLVIIELKSDLKEKFDIFFRFICHINNKSAIVFCNHRDTVEQASNYLKEQGIVNVFYHGGMEQQERESALAKFKNASSSILITTDLASRGLDIPDIKYVVHYDLPPTEAIYTHRNGRTARMEAGGKVVLIVGKGEYRPTYINNEVTDLILPEDIDLPEKQKWSTLFIAAGKKDKVNKIDIVGFLSKIGQLKQEEIGLIEVKDFFSFVAVRKLKVGVAMELIKNEKIKGKKVKIDLEK